MIFSKPWFSTKKQSSFSLTCQPPLTLATLVCSKSCTPAFTIDSSWLPYSSTCFFSQSYKGSSSPLAHCGGFTWLFLIIIFLCTLSVYNLHLYTKLTSFCTNQKSGCFPNFSLPIFNCQHKFSTSRTVLVLFHPQTSHSSASSLSCIESGHQLLMLTSSLVSHIQVFLQILCYIPPNNMAVLTQLQIKNTCAGLISSCLKYYSTFSLATGLAPLASNQNATQKSSFHRY